MVNNYTPTPARTISKNTHSHKTTTPSILDSTTRQTLNTLQPTHSLLPHRYTSSNPDRLDRSDRLDRQQTLLSPPVTTTHLPLHTTLDHYVPLPHRLSSTWRSIAHGPPRHHRRLVDTDPFNSIDDCVDSADQCDATSEEGIAHKYYLGLCSLMNLQSFLHFFCRWLLSMNIYDHGGLGVSVREPCRSWAS